MNLLRNAAVASPGTAISLHTEAQGEEARITVANPIAPEAAGLAAGMGAGMGVGLVIARTIVEAHGGTLTRQDMPGMARFIITLPLLSGMFA